VQKILGFRVDGEPRLVHIYNQLTMEHGVVDDYEVLAEDQELGKDM